MGRQRQRRQGPAHREGRQGDDVLRRRRARGPRARPRAERRPLRRDLAGRQDLPRGADGTSKTFFDPDDKYIWALAVDKSGNVFAATGDKGIIYKITPDGQGTPFYKTNATNVVSLAFARTGDLLAGTESPGRVFRIDRDGKAFVLLDSPYREIHAIRVADDGTIYAAAVKGAGAPSSSEDRRADQTPLRAAAAAGAVGVDRDHDDRGRRRQFDGCAEPASPSTASPRRAGRGGIYRIQPDGLWDLIWDTGDDVALRPHRRAGRQPAGRHGHRRQDLPHQRRSGARDAARARRRPAGHRAAPRAVRPHHRRHQQSRQAVRAVVESPARRGTYESDVRDAGTVATWGVIRWRARRAPGRSQFSTRSGNTATPDETWSAWSKAYTQRRRRADRRARTRAICSGASIARPATARSRPVLTSVTAAYLPRNLRPVVSSITVHPPGTVFQRPFSTGEPEIAGFEDNTSDGRPAARSRRAAAPAAAERAAARPPHVSEGSADVRLEGGGRQRRSAAVRRLYRREGETAWKVLKRGLWDPIFVWDTTSVPDGTYLREDRGVGRAVELAGHRAHRRASRA